MSIAKTESIIFIISLDYLKQPILLCKIIEFLAVHIAENDTVSYCIAHRRLAKINTLFSARAVSFFSSFVVFLNSVFFSDFLKMPVIFFLILK